MRTGVRGTGQPVSPAFRPSRQAVRRLHVLAGLALGLIGFAAFDAACAAGEISTMSRGPSPSMSRVGGDTMRAPTMSPRYPANWGSTGATETTTGRPDDLNGTAPGQPPIMKKKNAGTSGAPVRAGFTMRPDERRYMPGLMLVDAGDMSRQTLDTMMRSHGMTILESHRSRTIGRTLHLCRINDQRSVHVMMRGLSGERRIASAQPNYLYALQGEGDQGAGETIGDPAQYTVGKLRLPQAHRLATGDKVLVAVIDSGIDTAHPDLQGVIAGKFDAIQGDDKPHPHGTGMAGAIASRGKLIGVAPRVKLLAVRAFGTTSTGAEGTTFHILKGLDWAAEQGARVINMSFAGPADPALQDWLAKARKKGMVLIAAAGNAGPSSAPLYPAADPNVIAVTATDSDDKLFAQANRGPHIAVAAPGVDILVPAPEGTFQLTSGTSVAAAHVSGVAALLIERKSTLNADQIRKVLMSTAKHLGARGRDKDFGAGLIDAFGAVTSLEPRSVDKDKAGAREQATQ